MYENVRMNSLNASGAMDASGGDSPPATLAAIASTAGRAERILTLRESVIRMRGLATRSCTGFHEQLLSLARDTERHVTLLEALRVEPAAK